MHWLVHVVRKADLEGAESLDLDPELATAEAWMRVRKALGIDADALAEHVAEQQHLTVADPEETEVRARKLVPSELARRYHVYPLRENDHELTVATSDPTDAEAEQELGFASGRRVVFQIAPPPAIEQMIARGYGEVEQIDRLLEGIAAELSDSVEVVDDGEASAEAEPEEAREAPVVRLTNLILRDAVLKRASDIHLEPLDEGGTIRFRIDGVLQHQLALPPAALERIVSRVKVLGDMDIADRLRPQDGRSRIEVNETPYDLRISVIPTADAEKAVIRLLPQEGPMKLDELDLPAPEREALESLLAGRDGIVTLTGPTGSGKTTTLYAALDELSRGEVNVTTVEDPVEYDLSAITQMQVEPEQDVTFASALRAVLRQDPDIILVGETRDGETAEVAAQAAATGHLVLTTLHTNDAVSAVQRFLDLGLDRATLAATFRGAIAQRLVRQICEECARPVDGDLNAEERDLEERYGVTPRRRPLGCKACGRTGYRGRTPIAEVFVVDDEITAGISGDATAGELRDLACSRGMRPLRESALDLVRDGVTTLQEVDRVVGEDADETEAGDTAAGVTEDTAEDTAEEPDEETIERVLVVESDAEQREIACEAIRALGMEPVPATDGAEAIDRIDDEPFLAVVTGMELPEADGSEVIEHVRARFATASIPVLVLTSADDEKAEVQLVDEASADDYIRKPLEADRFTTRFRAVLRRAGLDPP
jgi:type II secretory ATPase GspE/PulE/Tfp pilus assembly ATPase PilB-like protein/ActR/RegA family two-component response regulator